MRSCKAAALFLVLGMFVSQNACWANDWVEAVSLKFPQDEKDWHEGWSKKDDVVWMMEFVHDNQTVEDWKELVTLSFMPGAQEKVTPQEFMSLFLQQLKETSPTVTSKEISSSDRDIIVQWQVHDDKNNPDQWELVRVLKGVKGLHVIHYAKKAKDIDPQEQATWLKFIELSDLVPPPEAAEKK